MFENVKEKLIKDQQITLAIKVHANAKQTRLKSILADGTIKIDIAKPAEDNKANKELIKLLANEFEINKNCIFIIHGKFSSDKEVVIKLVKNVKK